MPESLTIAIFVFGSILILIALLGGDFQLFGADIRGLTHKWLRPVSFVMGVIFISICIINPQQLISTLEKESKPSPTFPSESTQVSPATRKLRDLLAAEKWEEADEETTKIINASIVGVKNTTLTPLNHDDIPLNHDDLLKDFKDSTKDLDKKVSELCENVFIIDQLWLESSQGKFGFGSDGHLPTLGLKEEGQLRKARQSIFNVINTCEMGPMESIRNIRA